LESPQMREDWRGSQTFDLQTGVSTHAVDNTCP
jgi:hypothetical protein